MDEHEFTLDSLKDVELNGYLIFTDATETGEDTGVCIVITGDTKPGVDVALMNAGFNFVHERVSHVKDMYWMERGEKENLRYHPVPDDDPPMKTAITQGMKTRIDFFCREKGNAAYDVVNELLKLGYKVLTFTPHNILIEKLFLIELGANGSPVVQEVK